MNIRYRVELSQTERAGLIALLAGGKHAVRKLKRAQILWAAYAGVDDETIAKSVGSVDRRFIESSAALWKAGQSRLLMGSVECLARVQDFAEVFVRPEAERLDRAPQGMSEWGQSIIDPRRRGRCHRARHETIALQAAKRKGEHALRDAADHAFDLIEPLRSMPEQHHDQHRPFVRHPSEDGVESATVMTVGVREFNGHMHVPTRQRCAFLRALSRVSTLYQVAGCYWIVPWLGATRRKGEMPCHGCPASSWAYRSTSMAASRPSSEFNQFTFPNRQGTKL
jgi:hypothetical protein